MPINSLVPQYRSPVATYSALRQMKDQGAQNKMNMLVQGQQMRLSQQKEGREQQLQQIKGAAAVGQYLDQFGDEASKKQAFESIKGDLGSYGLTNVSPNVTYEDAKPHLEKAKLMVYGQPESPFSDINPSQYTPQSVQRFEQSGRYGDLVGREKKGVSQNVYTGSNPYMKKRLEGQAKMVEETTNRAASSVEKINSLEQFINKSDEAQQGSMQPLMTGVKNFFSSFGIDFESLQSEREMEQAIGNILANYMQELGARGLTDKDMEILRQALPRVNTDKQSRVAIARILQKNYAKDINEYGSIREQEAKAYPELNQKLFKPAWYEDYMKMEKPWEQQNVQQEAQMEAVDYSTMSDKELLDMLGKGSSNMGKVRIDERP